MSEPCWNVLQEVRDERIRQDEKWGEQNHKVGSGPFTFIDLADRLIERTEGGTEDPTIDAIKKIVESAFSKKQGTWAHILFEEVVEALESNSDTETRRELIQVAAVAVAMVECIDRNGEAAKS